jgi:hypothetical protein
MNNPKYVQLNKEGLQHHIQWQILQHGFRIC